MLKSAVPFNLTVCHKTGLTGLLRSPAWAADLLAWAVRSAGWAVDERAWAGAAPGWAVRSAGLGADLRAWAVRSGGLGDGPAGLEREASREAER